MPGPAVDTIQSFGSREESHDYTKLVDLFTDDAIYYDPFFGAQRGKAAIRSFMEHMEEVVPASGARFDDWHSEGDVDCGWARWTMVAPNADGDEVSVPGQSLYRLRDGKVSFVADHVDCGAYRRLRGADAKVPDHVTPLGMSASPDHSGGTALDTIRRFWAIQDAGDYAALGDLFADDAVFVDPIDGTFEGIDAIRGFLDKMVTDMPAMGATFELVDAAGDENVGWSQWWCRLPGGSVPGWSLYTVRDGTFTLDHDVFDTNAARAANS